MSRVPTPGNDIEQSLRLARAWVREESKDRCVAEALKAFELVVARFKAEGRDNPDRYGDLLAGLKDAERKLRKGLFNDPEIV